MERVLIQTYLNALSLVDKFNPSKNRCRLIDGRTKKKKNIILVCSLPDSRAGFRVDQNTLESSKFLFILQSKCGENLF